MMAVDFIHAINAINKCPCLNLDDGRLVEMMDLESVEELEKSVRLVEIIVD